MIFSCFYPFGKAGGFQIPCGQGIAIKDYGVTLDIVRYSFEHWTKQASTPQRPVCFDFVEVSFNVVHNPDQRQALNDIGTNFDLKDDAVNLLIKSADDVLRASPEFQAFLKRANGRFKQP